MSEKQDKFEDHVNRKASDTSTDKAEENIDLPALLIINSKSYDDVIPGTSLKDIKTSSISDSKLHDLPDPDPTKDKQYSFHHIIKNSEDITVSGTTAITESDSSTKHDSHKNVDNTDSKSSQLCNRNKELNESSSTLNSKFHGAVNKTSAENDDIDKTSQDTGRIILNDNLILENTTNGAIFDVDRGKNTSYIFPKVNVSLNIPITLSTKTYKEEAHYNYAGNTFPKVIDTSSTLLATDIIHKIISDTILQQRRDVPSEPDNTYKNNVENITTNSADFIPAKILSTDTQEADLYSIQTDEMSFFSLNVPSSTIQVFDDYDKHLNSLTSVTTILFSISDSDAGLAPSNLLPSTVSEVHQIPINALPITQEAASPISTAAVSTNTFSYSLNLTQTSSSSSLPGLFVYTHNEVGEVTVHTSVGDTSYRMGELDTTSYIYQYEITSSIYSTPIFRSQQVSEATNTQQDQRRLFHSVDDLLKTSRTSRRQ